MLDVGSLVPLEGIDDPIAQLVAIKKIEAHFYTTDSLASVTNHKLSLIQQKKTIDAQIKNEVNSELEKSKKGLEILNRSAGRTGAMSDSFDSTVDLCRETASLIGHYEVIKRVNTARVNMLSIIKEVDRLLTIPERAVEIETLMQNDINILDVHKKIRELERLYKNALKQFEANHDELSAIKDMFCSVEDLSRRFENKVVDLVSSSITVAQKNPAVLVKVAQIAERERMQHEKIQEKNKSALVSSEGIKNEAEQEYIFNVIELLRLSIASRFNPLKSDLVLGQSDLQHTLKAVNVMVDELTIIIDQVSECYPPSYDIFNFYVREYHDRFYGLFDSFSTQLETGVINSTHLAKTVPSAHILMLGK
eukprot:gene3865-4469_t